MRTEQKTCIVEHIGLEIKKHFFKTFMVRSVALQSSVILPPPQEYDPIYQKKGVADYALAKRYCETCAQPLSPRNNNSDKNSNYPTLLIDHNEPSIVACGIDHSDKKSLVVVTTHLTRKSVIRECQAKANKYQEIHWLFFHVLMRVYKVAVIGYLLLELLVVLLYSLRPFNQDTGSCLENVYPTPWIIILLTALHTVEHAFCLCKQTMYLGLLLRWRNPIRWTFRALEGALIVTFITSAACSLILGRVIAESIYIAGGVLNFGISGGYEKSTASDYATRELEQKWHPNIVNQILKPRRITTKRLCKMWFDIFIPVFAPVLTLWWKYFVNSLAIDDSVGATQWLWVVYAFGILQTMFIILIPALEMRWRDHPNPHRRRVLCEIWFTITMFVCRVGTLGSYMIVTRA